VEGGGEGRRRFAAADEGYERCTMLEVERSMGRTMCEDRAVGVGSIEMEEREEAVEESTDTVRSED
jgi:hypothetical protein